MIGVLAHEAPAAVCKLSGQDSVHKPLPRRLRACRRVLRHGIVAAVEREERVDHAVHALRRRLFVVAERKRQIKARDVPRVLPERGEREALTATKSSASSGR